MDQLLYYHNPRCSKSRQGLSLLEDKQVKVTVKEYLKEGLEKQELIKIFEKLGSVPIRRKETAYKELKLKSEPSLQDWANIIAENPILLERPILVAQDKAVVGRPPEDIISIL